jgi:hypothetical protein
MDVYLVPLGPDRYEVYYEAPDHEEPEEEEGRGYLARLRARFRQQLKDAERARHERSTDEPVSFMARVQKRSLAWVAERIAEQRLLWHLRSADAARLHAASDLQGFEADRIMRAILKRDADRHRIRLILHSLILIAVTPLTILPGPNVLGYLFTFTVVGHFLSWRGAVRGLDRIKWTIAPDAALTDLRRAFSMHGPARHELIADVARRLRLPKLTRFVERISAVS